MKKLADLIAARAAKERRLDELQALRIAESRELTTEETAEWDRIFAEAPALDADILRLQQIEDRDKQKVRDRAAAASTPEDKVLKALSFNRGLSLAMRGKKMDGAEAEVTAEAEKEWRDAGISHQAEGFAVPTSLMGMKGRNVISGKQVRELTVAGTATGAELVNEDYKGHIDGLHIEPMVVKLGATVLQGLTGTVKFTKSGTLTMVWEDEDSANNAGTPSTGEITLAPKRGGLYTDISKTLLAQTGGMAEEIVRRELSIGASVGIDAAALNGSAPGPTGLLGMSGGINIAARGTNGDVLTRAHLLEMRKLIKVDNAVLSDMNWLTTPGVEAFLMDLPIDPGSGRYVWNEDTNKIVGHQAYTSNNVPSTLTKGASASICHAIIFGCWNQLYIGQWGGLDFVIDPITLATTNRLRIVMNGYWDIKARNEEAFAVCKDVLVS